MKTTEYKIVCEVHILHDYYLLNSKHESFFGLDIAEQQRLLNRKLRAGQYDITKDINFLLNTEASKTINRYRLKVIKTPLGFFIGMEVRSEKAEDGSIRYRPVIMPPPDAKLTIGLVTTNPLFGSITNVMLTRSDKKIYFFTNQGTPSAQTLSEPISDFSAAQTYRMGDLTLLNGIVQQAVEENTGDPTKWEPISGDGFVHAADRKWSLTDDWYKDWLLEFSVPISTPFGILQLQFHTENPDSTLIDSDGFLVTRRAPGIVRPVPQHFELRFLSRSTYWRYQKREGFTDEEIAAIDSRASDFLALTERTFVTRKPRFFAQTLTQFENSILQLPNARPNALKMESGRLYSDIYFNKANPIP